MRRLGKLAMALSATTVVAVWSLGIADSPGAGLPAASAASLGRARAVTSVAVSSVPVPKRKPTIDATFTGSRLNTKLWDTCYPNMKIYAGGCTNWGNKEEAQWYLPSQVKVSGGHLRLIAHREKTTGYTVAGKKKTYECRSGMVTMYPGLKFKYGFVQILADIPHATGLWPALWLATASGSWPPEIDMLESWGVSVKTGSFYHPVTGTRSRATYSPSLTRGWHTYSLSWTSSKLTFYVDSRVVLRVTKNVPHQRMYLIADLAEYKPAVAGTCNAQMLVKSVKVWTG